MKLLILAQLAAVALAMPNPLPLQAQAKNSAAKTSAKTATICAANKVGFRLRDKKSVELQWHAPSLQTYTKTVPVLTSRLDAKELVTLAG